MYSVNQRKKKLKLRERTCKRNFPCSTLPKSSPTLILHTYQTCFHICARNFAKHTRRVNSISSCSLSVIGAGVGVLTVEFLSRWCLVLRRKSNDNIVDSFCSNFGECVAPIKGNRTSPKTTHRRNITVKPRISTSKRVRRPSNLGAMCEKKIHGFPCVVRKLFWTLAPAKEWTTVWNHAWRHYWQYL